MKFSDINSIKGNVVLGTGISDIDLSQPLTETQWEQIVHCWNERHLLFFPRQDTLTIDQHVAFLRRFGTVIEERNPGEKHSFVTNTLGMDTDDMYEGFREGALTPHMDYSYTRHPADIISLFAQTAPSQGSPTSFYSNTHALQSLPAALRADIASYHIRCCYDFVKPKEDIQRFRAGRGGEHAQFCDWPLIRSHPNKPGVEFLFCSLQHTERVLELSSDNPEADDNTTRILDQKSSELLETLYDQYLYVDSNQYDHHWQSNDLLVWDNLAFQHARHPVPLSSGDRVLRRVATCESGNGVQETATFFALQDASLTYT